MVNRVVADIFGRDFLMEHLYARHHQWDSTTNPKGKALVKETSASRSNVSSAVVLTYRRRGQIGSSTPYLVLKNLRPNTTETSGEGIWSGAYDHAPVLCTFGGMDGVIEDRRRKEVSKFSLQNVTGLKRGCYTIQCG